MFQLIMGGIYLNASATTTQYNHLMGFTWWRDTEIEGQQLISADGKLSYLRIKLNNSPGAGKKYTFTLMLNGAPTAMTLVIENLETSGFDIEHEITVTGGDSVSLRSVPSGTPTARKATWSIFFEGDTAKESLILGGTTYSTLDNGQTEYTHLVGGINLLTTENDVRQICPTAGTIKNLYVKLSEDPGNAPDAYTFTLRKGPPEGPQASTALTVTIVADNTTGNDTAHTVDVSPGDVLTMMINPVSGPAAIPKAQWGMTFLADVDDESIVLGGSNQVLSNSATIYNYLQVYPSEAWSETEATKRQLAQFCTLKKLYVLLDGTPGAGKNYTFTLRVASSDSNVVAVIADANKAGNSGALTDSVILDQYVDLKCAPTGTPTVRDAYWGFVTYKGSPTPPEVVAVGGSQLETLLKAGVI